MLKATLLFANSEPDSVKVLYKILFALPNIEEKQKEKHILLSRTFRSGLLDLGFRLMTWKKIKV